MNVSSQLKKEYIGIKQSESGFYPEGVLFNSYGNKRTLSSLCGINEAYADGRTLEGRVTLCDSEHNLHVDLGCMKGIIPRNEGALGIDDGTVRDIALISRVNKPVCFKIIGFDRDENSQQRAILSRKAVQAECMERLVNSLKSGDVIGARVTHLESFGVFADIGAGISALMPIDSISVSRIPHPSVRFTTGQDIRAVVKGIDEQNRVTLSHKELLGTWEQNVEEFMPGQTVPGIVRSVEKYGIFVELSPNLAGLAEYSEGIEPGNAASVYIKSIIPERMKIKLIIVDSFSDPSQVMPIKYYTDCDHIDRFVYSPECCEKVIESIF
ncbi:MAG: 30S ribosomal protein S1 [Clostridia bacterium]|nr:30S ribosomal protein S1 [Clostridia bacterium]